MPQIPAGRGSAGLVLGVAVPGTAAVTAEIPDSDVGADGWSAEALEPADKPGIIMAVAQSTTMGRQWARITHSNSFGLLHAGVGASIVTAVTTDKANRRLTFHRHPVCTARSSFNISPRIARDHASPGEGLNTAASVSTKSPPTQRIGSSSCRLRPHVKQSPRLSEARWRPLPNRRHPSRARSAASASRSTRSINASRTNRRPAPAAAGPSLASMTIPSARYVAVDICLDSAPIIVVLSHSEPASRVKIAIAADVSTTTPRVTLAGRVRRSR